MGELYRTAGTVVHQAGAVEFWARYSMNARRRTSVQSSLHKIFAEETERTVGNQWNCKYLRRQFYQKDLEELYRRYDDQLREKFIHIFISLLIVFSTIHIILVIASTISAEVQWHSMYLSMGMYVLRIAMVLLFLGKCIYGPLKHKYSLMPIFVTFIVTIGLVVTDIVITIYSATEGISVRPAYSVMTHLSIYIFLPMRSNFLAIILGIAASTVYIIIFALFTYIDYPIIGAMIASDIAYLLGVNVMGTYFRLMTEIVTRRSYLDRRACVESTLQLNFVKEQEERLMLSILPEHIVSRVRKDIRDILLQSRTESHTLSHNMRHFNRVYVEEHGNVSILYADVVNYTMISTTLSPLQMIELLNELFSRFDDASEEHDVYRIKFLGDCYYCVSGISKDDSMHAKNCVDLGLEMISIIKNVREKRSLNIDMRIGVHTGRILSGLIGIRKWQYDIWSKDATIANKMESTGEVGKVHVTKQTLDLLLDYAREYIIEPNYQAQENPFIVKNKLETYLISRPTRAPYEYKAYRRLSVGMNKIIRKRRSENRNSTNFRRTTTFMDENLVEYQQMLRAADAQMANEIEDMSKGKDLFRTEARLNRFTLMYKDWKMEKNFLLLPDPLFQYYITCCLLIFMLILVINGFTTNWLKGFNKYTWLTYGLLVVALIIMQPLTWFEFIWTTYRGIIKPTNKYLCFMYSISRTITKSAKIRTIIYLLISVGLAATSIVNVISCTEVEKLLSTEVVLSNCVSSWHVTQCWVLVLLLNFLFSRVFFIFKWIVAGGMTCFYLYVIWDLKSALFKEDATWNIGLDPRISHTLTVVFITMTLYWIDRTTEYRNRLDYLWQVQLIDEQKEAETMLEVHNMLLDNILPAHVVQVYLDLNRSIDELYYEKYDNVAVMFASLTDYKLGVEDDGDLNDKFFLRILDEIISDFDRLLLMGSSTHKVEKIKMAGWTYMAACGLDPTRRESFDSISYNHSIGDSRQTTPYNKAILITMVEFAAAIMMQLQTFNRGSFQSFEGMNIRIGISNGKVAAGVVGSLKPLYDIWGHAVNMASRMDSTGEAGKIQVTENTAYILDECGILTTYRGETFVKGAGYIKTYFVPLDEKFCLIKKEQSMEYYRIHDKSRYCHLKNAVLSDDSWMEDNKSQSSTYDVRTLSMYDGNSDEDSNNSYEGNDYINNRNKSHASLEHEVIETRC
ncbi:adenylate cyclase type 2-like [Hyposmocoma kahamanoa]|uniref:adenylate cyclase type 2-like n=1 Tax=Hyposmocoma kahamanoa TaxID=1477025 RepID=UPI000E6D9562|nr:adenylate cyclase type 2-like [Hyposmocoma kahamanoa]